MSGHSHYSTIKRQKGIKDAQKGRVFSKLSRLISLAVKAGGGITDPSANYKLRMAIESARAANMPKENVERAISRAGVEAESLEEMTYEGYGPMGIAVIVEVTTDSRNRTGQEIKNIFERVGGSLGGPGSVSFNFDTQGLIVIPKSDNAQTQILNLIDMGVEDFQEEQDSIEIYTQQDKVSDIKEKLIAQGINVVSSDIIKRPKNYQTLTNSVEVERALNFLEKIEDHDDVQKVFTNIDIPDELINKQEAAS